MTWNERAKELRKTNTKMCTLLPDGDDTRQEVIEGFKDVLILFPICVGMFILFLFAVAYGKEIDAYMDGVYQLAIHNPLQASVICFIFGVIGCAWLVKRAMQ